MAQAKRLNDVVAAKSEVIQEPEESPVAATFDNHKHPMFAPPKSMQIGELLTPPLVSISHEGRMIIECMSEMYEETLMGAGRTDKSTPATLLKCIDWTNTNEPREVILICNEMMKHAFKRAGEPLKGSFFAIVDGDLKADKKYRHVDVRRIIVER